MFQVFSLAELKERRKVCPRETRGEERQLFFTGGTELGVSRGNVEKETWWWNEGGQEFVEEKRLTKKWDSERTEESRQKQGQD